MTNPLQPSLFGDEPMKALRDPGALRAPFPYFGGKSGIASLIWYAFGEVKQYIEPFCGSAAVLLANPSPASLEVAGDVNCYLANFWRALKHQPEAVAAEADYPVSHIDLAARHRWLVEPERVAELAASLADPEWAGDTKIAGWWCWGQCAWIGSGWCESRTDRPTDRPTLSTARSPRSSAGEECSQVPFVGHRGRGLQRGGNGQIPHVTDGGRGIQRERERESKSRTSRRRGRAFVVEVPLTAPSCSTGCTRCLLASSACESSTARGNAA